MKREGTPHQEKREDRFERPVPNTPRLASGETTKSSSASRPVKTLNPTSVTQSP